MELYTTTPRPQRVVISKKCRKVSENMKDSAVVEVASSDIGVLRNPAVRKC
jgi:hypothetical protein